MTLPHQTTSLRKWKFVDAEPRPRQDYGCHTGGVVRMRGLKAGLVTLCAVWIAFTTCGAGPQSRPAAKSKTDYVRFSRPDALTFDELVQLEKQATPPAPLAKKLNKLVTTPFISNEAFYTGAQP